MKLVVRVRHRLDRFPLDVEVEFGDGLTALLGESGAGKTSLLNVIAGLLRPDEARVDLDGDVLTDTAAGRWLPAHQRRVGYVFQESRLFPHLTVRQNLGFGRWFTRAAGNGAALADVVSLLDLEALLHRHPSKLSGGEQRRVALGRALLANPRLLLLDEPLGSVDVARRQEILPYLDRLIAELKLPMIYVTHDEREVEGRAARVVRMRQGAVVDEAG
jgi:molybdate transport system ATP-binding protein